MTGREATLCLDSPGFVLVLNVYLVNTSRQDKELSRPCLLRHSASRHWSLRLRCMRIWLLHISFTETCYSLLV